MAESAAWSREESVRRGRRLEHFTVAWNVLKGLIAAVAGIYAGSISLVGFEVDSFIEVAPGLVLLWRMSVDADVERRVRNERRTLKIVGTCFLALAVLTSVTNRWWIFGPRRQATWDPLRSDPRFADLVRRIGLPP